MILTLPFLGERNYLQGATLLEAVLKYAGNPQTFSFKIKKSILSNRVELSKDDTQCAATLFFKEQRIFIKEVNPLLPINREQFDETSLARTIEKKENLFVMPYRMTSSLRSMILAFKHILLTHYALPSRPGRWAFVGLDAEHFLFSNYDQIFFDRILCHSGMACCSVGFDTRLVATLYFAWADI